MGSVSLAASPRPMSSGAAGQRLEGGVASDVVGVAVGEQDRGGFEGLPLEPGDDLRGLEAGVDHEALGAAGAPRHVGVLAEGQ